MTNSKKKISKSDVKKHSKTARGKLSKGKKVTMATSKRSRGGSINLAALSGEYGSGNYFKYDVKASQVSDEDIKRMAKLANDRLYKLEKSGQWEYSREYKVVEHYAFGDPNGKGSIYNVPDDFSRIRFTSSTTGMTPEERSYYVNTLRNFLRSETSTVSGTKESMKKAYTTFMKNHGQNIPSMTQDQYGRLWKAYRENAMADKISHQGYNAFLQLVENSNIYDLNNNELEAALWYLKNSEEDTTIGIINDVLWNSPWIDFEG